MSFSSPDTSTNALPIGAPAMPGKLLMSSFYDQAQSPLFSRIPAEIRNEIYCYSFFGTGARELLSTEAHPLSFLLTCRNVYHEASTVAFRNYTFPLPTSLSYRPIESTCTATSHFLSQQVEAITSVSYDLRRRYGCSHLNQETSNVLRYAVLTFPNLKRVELRLLRGRKTSRDMHCSYNPSMSGKVRKNAMRKYVSHWLSGAVTEGTRVGHVSETQENRSWKIEWPQLNGDTYLETLEQQDEQGDTCQLPYMGPEAVGEVRGVQMCPCNCGSVAWTCADMIQETGQRVEVDVVYYGFEDRVCADPSLEAAIKARLAGKPSLILTSNERRTYDGTVTSLAWESDEEYWEALRRKNEGWRAIYRNAWQLLTSITPRDRSPGSMSLKEGDWVVMAEMAKNDADPDAASNEQDNKDTGR